MEGLSTTFDVASASDLLDSPILLSPSLLTCCVSNFSELSSRLDPLSIVDFNFGLGI